MAPPDPSEHLALLTLSQHYAAAVDRRDRGRLLAVFVPDALLQIFDSDEPFLPVMELHGHGEIGQITDRIARYERTFHLVGAALYDVDVDGAAASGEVYCVGHHLLRRDGLVDHVMYIRYVDEYCLDPEVGWQITNRRLLVDWSEQRPVPDDSRAAT